MEKMRNEKKTAKKGGGKTGDLCGFLSISSKNYLVNIVSKLSYFNVTCIFFLNSNSKSTRTIS